MNVFTVFRGKRAPSKQTAVRDETTGESTPSEATLGLTSTYDPNATVPHLSAGTTAGVTPTAAFTAESESQRYRILGPLGEGGMGIVYRAVDTRLGRHVALKTVPAELTANRRAKELFLNEARAASALDHPNICTVYEIEERGDGQLYLSMPCYDGETLKSRLQRGPLPLVEAVQIAQQVARGLAKAHSLGIIHCDIKPANLMLTGDGLVKILDFGIARLSGQAPHHGPCGTPRYRSPEQARGGEVDASSDVWALGVVLHEMLTGHPPLRAENGGVSPGEELGSITRLVPEAPPELDGILSRMLAQHPADRYRHAAALLADLDRLENRISGLAERRRATRLRQILLAAGFGIVVLASLSGVLILRSSGSSERRPPRSEPTFSQITDFPGRTSYPSLSPDGSAVLYTRSVGGRSHIFSQPPVRGADAVDLTADSPADDTQPAFSPDGRQIAFRSERAGGGIFLTSARGGAVRRLTDFGFNPSWSPDGKEIACGTTGIVDPRVRPTASEIFRVDIATGARRRVTRGDAAQPSWSPDGRWIAYWGVLPRTGQRLIWTVPAEGGDPTPVVVDRYVNWNPVWAHDGRFLYFASDRSGIMNLWRVPIDKGSGRVEGEPEPVTTSQQACMLPSLSRDGRHIAYASDGSRGTLEKVLFDSMTGRVFGSAAPPIVQTSGVIAECSASLDGNWLTYRLLTPREDLFIVHPDGLGRRQLTGDEYKNRLPQFSPDSSRIAFYSNRSGKYEVWTVGVDGSGLAQETSIPGKSVSTALWSSDGRMFACTVDGREALIDLTKPLRERLPQLLPRPASGTGFTAFSWSADGKWLAGSRHRKGGVEEPGIWLYSLASKRYLKLTRTGDSPIWLHDSRRLLYFEGDRLLLLDSQTGRSRPVLASPASSTYMYVNSSPDDRALYIARVIDQGHIWLLNLE
jgi:eukaryotic-like serine/threonine-protein kinase